MLGARLFAAASLLVVLVLSVHAAAQPVSLETRVSRTRVSMGESFVVQLTALAASADQTPQNPALRVPPGVTAHGPSVGSNHHVTFSGGQMQQRIGITASWTVTASRVGKLRIGPASVEVGGRRVQDEPVIVEVVPAGQAPRPPPSRRWPFDPNDPFGGGFSFPDMDLRFPGDALDQALPPVPEEYRVEQAKDPVAFIRASVVPARVVVGEQVNLRVYAYGSRGPFNEAGSTEPTRADFLSYSLNDSPNREAYQIQIGDQVWLTEKVRDLALFPIRAGTFQIGAMRLDLNGRRYGSGTGQPLSRRSDPVSIVVVEPPLQGRPPGYRIGDVGRYELSADVAPRELDAGGALQVVVKVEGVGNVPQSVRVPQQHGVEWSQPSVTDDVAPQGRVISGWRKFSYIVRIEKSGQVELGEIRLPYFDPEQQKYEVASATLGSVTVRGSHNLAAAADRVEKDDLALLLTPRTKLGKVEPRGEPLTDKRWFWPLLALGPLSILMLGASVRVFVAVRRYRKARDQAHETRAGDALRHARQAANAGDGAATASAVERALLLAVEAATGLRARAVLRDRLGETLEQTGLSSEVATDIVELLKHCDGTRFGGSVDEISPRALVEQGEALVRRITRKRRPARSTAPSAALFYIAVSLALAPGFALAAAAGNMELFTSAAHALAKGAHEEAIDALELMGDRGYSHPDVSFNRALAYLMRVRSPQAKPGDLGRVAAALSETLSLRPNDSEAAVALDKVRAEIARRRARQGGEPILARPALQRAIVELLPENVWAVLATLGSFVLAAGMFVSWFVHRPGSKVGGSTAAAVGLLVMVVGGGMALAARNYRLTSRPAVVVVPEARWVTEAGTPTKALRGDLEAIPEGAQLFVREQRPPLARVEWGSVKGWIRLSDIRLLAVP